MSPSPVSIQTDVAYKLVQVPVGALALHATRQTHQAVDVLYLRGDLKALGMIKYICNAALQ